MNVAIIGGGWSGLSAAVELTTKGAQVTVFEAGRLLGGRARSVVVNGTILDNGQHILLGAYRDTLAVMRLVGVDPEKCLRRLPLTVLDHTGFKLALPRLPTPLNLAVGLIGAKGIRTSEKLRTAWWIHRLKQQSFQLTEDISVSEWLDQSHQFGDLRTKLWEPLCLAALNTPAERASAQIFANVLRDSLGSRSRADTDLLIPTQALGTIFPEPAKTWLELRGAKFHLGHRVQKLEGTTVDGTGFDAVIIAVSPSHAEKLIPTTLTHSSLETATPSGFEPDFEPITTVYLQFPSTTQLPFPLVGLAGQWAVDRGEGLISCVLSGHDSQYSSWETLCESELISALCAELKRFGIQCPPLWHKKITEKRATFSCQPNLRRPNIRTSHPKIFQIGDYTWSEYPATIEGAVRSGRHAAQLLYTSVSV